MTVEISSLRIEVVTTGIDEANKGMASMSTKAGNASSSVKKLSDNLASLLIVTSGATEKLVAQIEAISNISSNANIAAVSIKELASALSSNGNAAKQGVSSNDSLQKGLRALANAYDVSAKAATNAAVKQERAATNRLSYNINAIGSVADKATSKIAAFTNAVVTMGTVSDSAANKLTHLQGVLVSLASNTVNAKASMSEFNTEARSVVGNLQQMSRDASSLEKSLTKSSTAYSSISGQLGASSSSASGASNSFLTLSSVTRMAAGMFQSMLVGGVIFGLAAGLTSLAKSSIEASDAWTNMTSKLRNATGSLDSAKTAQQDLYDLSMKLRVPTDDLTKLYTRMVVPLQKIGKGMSDAKSMVEGVNLALQLNGSTAGEASSVMLQFSQSIAAGRLNGAEFNAVAENAPPILRAIEDELKRTGDASYKSGDSLKKMAADGKIGVELIHQAIMNAMPKWRREFENLPLTVDQSMTLISNAWRKMIGESEDVRSAIASIAKGFQTASLFIEEYNKVSKELSETFKNNKRDAAGLSSDTYLLGKTFEVLTIMSSSLKNHISGMFAELSTAVSVYWLLASGKFAEAKALSDAQRAKNAETNAEVTAFASKIWGMTDRIDKRKTKSASALKSIAGMEDELDSEQRRMLGRSKVENPYFNAAGLDTVREWSKTRNSIIEEYDQKILDTRKSFGAAMNKALTEGEKDKLKSEMTERISALQNAKTDDLAALARKDEKRGEPSKHDKAVAAVSAEVERLTKNYNDEIAAADKLTKAQKMLNDFHSKGSEDYNRLTASEKAAVDSKLAQLDLLERERDGKAELTKATEKQAQEVQTAIQNSIKERDALKEKVENQERLATAIAQTNMAATANRIEELSVAGASPESLANLYSLYEVQKQILELNKQIDTNNITAATDKLLNPEKIKTFADTLKETFKDVGGSIGKSLAIASTGMKNYEVAMLNVSEARELANKEATSEADKARLTAYANKEEAKATILGYADMAGAAKGFFKIKSAGYELLSGIEKSFRAYQMAKDVEDFARKSGLWTELGSIYTALTTVKMAEDDAETVNSVDNSIIRGFAYAKEAIAAALALPPPAGWIAAGITGAIVAGLGFAVFGGGSHSSVKASNNGTGTVLGKETAASESLKNSLDKLSSIDTVTMRNSADMVSSLKNIDSNISSLATMLVRQSGSNTAVNSVATYKSGILDSVSGILGPLQGLISNLGSAIFSSKVSVSGQGITGNSQSLGSVMDSGFDAQWFANVNQKRKLFGITMSDSSSTVTNNTGTESLDQQFSTIFQGFAQSLLAANKAMGGPISDIESKVRSFVIDIGNIDLQGLDGDKIQEKLNAVIGQVADKLSAQVFSGYEKFQKVGEGYLETIVRVASGVEEASVSLRTMGVSASSIVNVLDVVNKQATNIGSEIVRQSVVGLETVNGVMSGVGQIINSMSGDVSALTDKYKELVNVRKALEQAGLGSNLNSELIIAAGGLSNLSDALSAYNDKFFTDAEKQAKSVSSIRLELSKLTDKAMPTTVAGFRSLVESIQGSGNTELAVKVMELANSFYTLAEAGDKLLESARSDLTNAYQKESSALTDTKTKFEDFAKSLKDFRISLITGDMSPLTALEKYQQSSAKYSSTYAKALTGDADAISAFQSVAQDFLNMSRTINASGDQYSTDFKTVTDALAQLEGVSTGKASEAAQQLDALKTQVGLLVNINDSVLSVTDAISKLEALMTDSTITTTAVNGSHANGLSYVPFDGYVAELHKGERVLTATENKQYASGNPTVSRLDTSSLVDEVRALRQQVADNEERQARRDAAAIAANYDANERNASSIVEGTKDAVSVSSYSERAKVKLA